MLGKKNKAGKAKAKKKVGLLAESLSKKKKIQSIQDSIFVIDEKEK